MEVLGEHYQPVDVEAACIIQRNNSTSRSIEWSSPSPSSAPAIYSHNVEATPINNIPYSEENCKVEYPLHPVCRLLAFIGFLFSGAVGLFLALYGLVLILGVCVVPILALTTFEAHDIIAYLGFTVSVLLISMVLLEMATSGVLVVTWKSEGRVPYPGNLGLGSLFLGFGLSTCVHACRRDSFMIEIREYIDFINGLSRLFACLRGERDQRV